MKIIVLGAGLIGGPMAMDLATDRQFEVCSADRNKESLSKVARNHPISTVQRDLSNPKDVKTLVSDYDMVINALPGSMGFKTLKAIIEAKKNMIDISFFPEDPFQLDALARTNKVVAIIDCGVAPGMSNILAGYADFILDKSELIKIYVGGLPELKEWPFEYKAVFSLPDVLEEYTRPARCIENGKLVTKSALSDAEYIYFPRIGTLEAFNTDGLRTLSKTIDAAYMIEKTLRYPGHIEKIKVLRETGFFSKKEIKVKEANIRPFDLTSNLLFPKWQLKEGDTDITVMRIIIEGKKEKNQLRYVYDLFDRYDVLTKVHSMARTTGYTATVALRMIASGLYTRKGISAPEFIGRHPECVDFMLEGLKERGVIYKETIEMKWSQ